MNSVLIIGRLSEDPTTRWSQGEKSTCFTSFQIAVDRNYKDKNGKVPTDFFRCKSVFQTAEFIDKYFSKGMKIAITGHLEVEKWEKDGQKYQQVVINCDHVDFCEKKEKSESKKPENEPVKDKDGFLDIAPEDLPFM